MIKEIRQRAILDIIAQKDIETQFDLIRELNERGVKSTQATVSRDIKELRLYKELTGSGSYRYASPVADVPNNSEKLRTIFRESLTSCVCAENIVVIKTLPGLASAACSASVTSVQPAPARSSLPAISQDCRRPRRSTTPS